VRHEPGKGKHSGKVGALYCEMGNGKKFAVGSGLSDQDREDPPPIGSIITFRYQELTEAGIPRFPTFVCVRIDAEWPPKNKEPSAASSAKPKKQKEKNEKLEKKEKTEKTKKPSKPAKKQAESDSEDIVSTKAASSDILDGVQLCITGTLSLVRREMVDKIQSLGGSFSNTVSKHVTYLIATVNELEVNTKKVSRALDLGIPILSEDWLHESEKRKKKLDIKSYLLTTQHTEEEDE